MCNFCPRESSVYDPMHNSTLSASANAQFGGNAPNTILCSPPFFATMNMPVAPPPTSSPRSPTYPAAQDGQRSPPARPASRAQSPRLPAATSNAFEADFNDAENAELPNS